ncbi:MAG: hypothetical protein ACFFDN_36760, partial [Candidatus Hodarchaeota archaeon]
MSGKVNRSWKDKSPKELIRNNWEFITSLLVLWGLMVGLLIYSFNLNEGHIIYALDDAYIHMAIAKNFSRYGVWGITKKKFSSSSSSLLYTLLLSLIFLFGPNELVPLIINLIFANILLYIVFYIFKIKYNIPSYSIFSCLLLMIFFIPLHFLVFTGMEHTIQITIDILFVYYALKIICNENLNQKKILVRKERSISFLEDKYFFILAPLVTMVRFEGMFLIIIISFLFLLRKSLSYSTIVLLLGFLPIIIFGMISLYNGWYFFPNSVILKGNIIQFTFPAILELFLSFIDELFQNYHIGILLVGALWIFLFRYKKKKSIWNEPSIMAVIFMGVTLLHILLIGSTLKNQNLSRYDGYIIALGIIMLFLSIKDAIPKRFSMASFRDYLSDIKKDIKIKYLQVISVVLIVIIFFWIFIPRSFRLIRDTPQATNNIYEQQYQMGLFLEKYYEGEVIAVNDIGAVNYLTDIKCIDLRGLGSHEVADAIQKDKLDEDFVDKITKEKRCKIAIIYEEKDYGYDIPEDWIKAGEWEIKNNVVCGDD